MSLGGARDVRRALKVPEIVLYMLEVMNGVRCVLWVLFCFPETVEGELCLLEVLD